MTTSRLEGFFELIETTASRAAGHPDAFGRIRAGTLQGVLVTDVLSDTELANLVPRLERHDPPFLKTWFPDKFRSWFYGRCLDLTPPDLASYFDEAKNFRTQLATLSVMDRVLPVLAALDGGRAFRAPPGPAPGEEYMITTLRGHLPGGFIPPHCENEQLARPPYRHLRTLVQPHVLSFVLALTQADAGGALEVFDLRFDAISAASMRAGRTDVAQLAATRASVPFVIPPGALLIVDGGRYIHQLTRIEGERVRWTVSSFMAEARDGSTTYCWG